MSSEYEHSCQSGPYQFLPDPIPQEIKDAALKVHTWMASNGHKSWQLYGIFSRDFASEVEDLRDISRKYDALRSPSI